MAERTTNYRKFVSTVAQTACGAVEGELRANHVVFRGIPFAAPPIGKRRFAPPNPPIPWTSVRPAKEFGPSAMQGDAFAPGAGAEGPTSEDCLYLNVYTPGLNSRRRPVLVFIHGGAFIIGSGSSPLYDGGRLAELGDQVVVTFNYRLGAFGYLCLGEAGSRWGATANAGTLDQLAALRWVQTNIDRFGGDPHNVTVFGESAGATSVLHLLAMPAAEGLFHRAIAQSSAAALTLAEPSLAIELAEQLLSALDLRPCDSERLRELPGEAIRDAQLRVRARPADWLGYFPVLDAQTVPEQPRDLFASGAGARVPLVIGTNRDEWNLFDLASLGDAKTSTDPEAELVAAGFPAAARDRIDEVLEIYSRSRKAKRLPHHDRALFRALVGDLKFRIPSLRFAEAHAARGLPTYAYFFTYPSPAVRGTLGACHALDLPFVFGTLDAPLQEHFAGTGQAVQELSAAMMRAWSMFAATGAPHVRLAEEWPRYDVERRTTRVFDVPSRIEHAPHDDERAAWDGIL